METNVSTATPRKRRTQPKQKPIQDKGTDMAKNQNTPEEIKANVSAAATIPGDDFENPNVGETFGGSYPQLNLEEDKVSNLLVYVKDTKVQVENDNGTEMVSAPVCRDTTLPEGSPMFSLPISQIFRKHFAEANVSAGDTLRVKRYKDAIKKRGKGSGNKMKVFAVKVYSRAAKPASA